MPSAAQLELVRPVPAVSELLDAEQLAARLNVPVSWVRSRTRQRTAKADRIPHVQLGRYCRFRWLEVESWLQSRVSQ
jgi:hypothetical protein